MFSLHVHVGGKPRNVLRVALVGLALVVLALLVGDARSAAGDTRLIAFTRPDGIYVIRADGRGERPLRRGGAAAGATRVAWSPDGTELAFTSKAFTTKNGIWAMDADGSNLVRLVAGADLRAVIMGPLTWLPDGRRVAFTAFRRSATGTPGNWDIWVVNADGTNAHPLRETPHLWEFDVDSAPAGDRIAFTDLRGGGMGSPLRVMVTNGKTLRSINPGSTYQTAMPDWAPDGRRLAFIKWPYDPESEIEGIGILDRAEIWVATPSGKAQQLTRNRVNDRSPAWSPDGGKVAFVRGGTDVLGIAPERDSPAEIYLMNADGTGVTRLTHNEVGEGSPAWQPRPAS